MILGSDMSPDHSLNYNIAASPSKPAPRIPIPEATIVSAPALLELVAAAEALDAALDMPLDIEATAELVDDTAAERELEADDIAEEPELPVMTIVPDIELIAEPVAIEPPPVTEPPNAVSSEAYTESNEAYCVLVPPKADSSAVYPDCAWERAES